MISHHHHLLFVILSIVVAILGSWTALDLFRRARAHIGQARRVWLLTAGVAMGSSIWSMHFIAMLGFDPGSPVSYDPVLTLLSLALAIIATSGAFLAATRQRATIRALLVAGLAMGVGICTMHYVGMAALRSAVSLGYRPGFVALSFVIAVSASTAALLTARQERSAQMMALASVTLGLAIVGMHYTAMAGLQITRLTTTAAPPGAPPFILGVAVATGTLVILTLALLASLYDQRLNVLAALDAGGVGYWELTVPEMTLQVSPGGKAIFERGPDEPFGYADLIAALPPDDLERRQAKLAKALEDGSLYEIEYRLTPEGKPARWVNTRGRVVATRNGRPRRMAGVVQDVTAQRDAFERVLEAEQVRRVLIDELNHRVKNTLFTVQSIARQTAKGATSIEAFRKAFDARLISLSNTHNALTRGNWESASLRELLTHEFAPYRAEQVKIDGEDLQLSARQALAFGMIAHELATNAAKYGALAHTDGCVKVVWTLEAGRLRLEWKEAGGAAAMPPADPGFGTRLIRGIVETELHGEVDLEFAADGFACRIETPMRSRTPEAEDVSRFAGAAAL
ncbi:MHYT domain-containing protein [Phenylobacterium sp.]|uniref:MHYT domain-containing protein n=1 Tax=Phenylobacterium sp. TaxID=1871053 RepID=UPI0037841981